LTFAINAPKFARGDAFDACTSGKFLPSSLRYFGQILMLTLFNFAVADNKWKPDSVRRKEKRHREKAERSAAAAGTFVVTVEPTVAAPLDVEDNAATADTAVGDVSQPVPDSAEASSLQSRAVRKQKGKQRASRSRKRGRVSAQDCEIVCPELPLTEPIPCASVLPTQVIFTVFLFCLCFILFMLLRYRCLFCFLGRCRRERRCPWRYAR